VNIRNCLIQDWNWNGHGAKLGDGESYKGYGIQVISSSSSDPSDNWIIMDNTMIVINVSSGEDTTAINIDAGGHASIIASNLIDGNNRMVSGIMVWRPRGASKIFIKKNIISNTGAIGINVSEFDTGNFSAEVLIEQNIIENSCTRDVPDEEALRVWTKNTAPVTIRNNLIDRTFDGKASHHGIRIRESNVSIYNNTIYAADIGISLEENSLATSLKNNISSTNRIAAFYIDQHSSCNEEYNIFFGKVIGLKLSPTSLAVGPRFIDPDSQNFRLKSDSPAIDRGTAAGNGLKDLDDIPRPLGSGWDIGAFEFANQPLTPPKNLKLLN
jgi:hypothetical protein